MIFIFILPLKLEVVKYHNLLSVKISSLQDVFTRIIQTGNKYSTQIHSNALVSHGNKTRGSTSHDKSGKNHEIWEVVCYYYHESDHTKCYCQKLQEKARRTEMTHVAVTSTKTISYENSTPITTIFESGNSYKCLISSFFNWVIDSGATDYMTGNPNLFLNFKAYTHTPNIIFTNGSTSRVIRSGTVNLTSFISFNFMLSLLKFSFNLLCFSKLTRALNYCVSSFFLLIVFFKILRQRKLLVEVMSMEDIMYLMHKC
uniref:Retrovirus-related Pol polyprotein from transposon TNT 1-94-like beta-barrel domain-containing protein n=1 Tax=Gossypium raimondii TaxID=29730 RepID=A0A0D2SSD8_GOSRA|nr:hypothetical protein B456_006G052700 [Gossypium raimondii]